MTEKPSELDSEEVRKRELVSQLLKKYRQIIFIDEKSATKTDLVQCKLWMKHDIPIRTKLRPLGHNAREWLRNEIEELLKAGVIRPSRSPYASAPVIVEKKDGSWRLAIDYRRINMASEDFLYPLPKISEIFDQFAGAKIFTTLDLARGYWQIAMDPESIKLTAFITPFGQFEFTVMPFGLKQAPGWFQLLMNEVLREEIGKFCLVYLDDVIIYSKTIEEHKRHVEIVFQKIKKALLQIKQKKCHFFQKVISFLGHRISEKGIETDPDKTRAMSAVAPPTDLKGVQSILGLFNYYRNFVPDFAKIASPIYKLLKKGTKIIWTEECQKALDILKKKMIEAPILAHPDFTKPFTLYTDASYSGLGYILSQNKDEIEHPIKYGSRKLKLAEQNYTITEVECSAVVWSVRENKQFLGVNLFTLISDHKALETLRKQDLTSLRQIRWVLELDQYNYIIQHRKGKKMAHVDYFSRYPVNKTVQFSEGPDMEFYEEPWDPRYQATSEEVPKWEPTITVVVAGEENPWKTQPLVEYPWWEAPVRNEPWWEEPKLVQAEKRMDHSIMAVDGPKFVLTILHDEYEVYLSQRINPEKPMYLNYQAPCGKTEPEETSIQAAHRETYEETSLSLAHKRFRFLINDPDFDCDIYTCKLKNEEIPQRTEPDNMTDWLYYPWKSAQILVQQNRTTPSITKYFGKILDRCMLEW